MRFRGFLLLRSVAFILSFFLSSIVAASSFTVTDIRVEGIQRVSAGTVFASFPVVVGDEVEPAVVGEAVRTLFQTGLFTDIQVGREDNDIIITVKERPSISKIEIEGNKDISTDDLMDGLKSAGLVEGQVFQRVTLERLELEILRSYVGQGRYNSSVEASVKELPRNRVSVHIKIREGKVSSIHHINFVGNQAFSDDDLRDLMELKLPGFWSFIMNDDRYSKEKLSGDLERIRSHYLNNGYVKFSIDSTQVSVSPNKEDVFISVNVTEGDLYTIKDISLKGELILDEDEIQQLIFIEEGETFSRQKLTTISELISKRLGKEGFTFANVNAIPEANDDKTVSVTFFVDPGKRTYVRRVNFRGNITTSDEVLRQEMRQMEGASASTDLIEASKSRLERLGFFKTVTVETPSVPGVNDQIDVNYSVEEQPSGSLSASLGFSQTSGFMLGFSVSENNFFGTGRRVTTSINTSDSVKSARFSYLNPYYTVDGVSRGFAVFAKQTDFEEENTSAFVLDAIGASVTFGYPIDNFSRLSFGAGFTNSKIQIGDEPAAEISNFVNRLGDNFDAFMFTGSWSRSTLNRGTFPTRGWSQSVSLEVTVPSVSDLEYMKASYKNNFYYPLSKDQGWVGRLRSNIGYGSAWGDTDELPFFEHYYAGGYGSVRGYESNSLGLFTTPHPNDQDQDGDPFGGNLLVEAGAELIFPIPFVKDQSTMRASFFVDAGNVFDNNRYYGFDLSELRMSAGIGFQWLTAIGPLGFSLAKPFNNQTGDETQVFQFSLGQSF